MVQRYTRSVTFHDSLQDYTIGTEVGNSTYRLEQLTVQLIISLVGTLSPYCERRD
jgi:hypothetical protein